MFGILLDSLSYRIDKNLRESTYINETYKENKWSFLEYSIIGCSKHLVNTMTVLLLFFSIYSFLIYNSIGSFRESFLFWSDSWKGLIEWQSSFLASQITVLALIFPLVIAFVGFLIQNKSSQRALWKIYTHYSGFKVLGFSGVLLSTVILVIQFLNPWLTYQQEVSLSIGILIWLIINMFLLAWFLYATFDFISTEKRSNIILRYCINEMLINEIKHRLANLLPATIFTNNENDDTKAKVYTFYHFSEQSQDILTKEFKDYKYVYDIRLNLLKLAGYIWKLRNKNFKGNTPILYLPVSSIGKAKIYNLAYSENTNITKLEKTLIKLAYSFRSISSIEESNFDSIVHALVGNVEDSLKEQDERLFEIAMDELAYWYIQILKTASFTNDNGNIDNWILLQDDTLLGRTLADSLSYEFYKINKKSINLIQYSNEYYRKMTYFYLHILGYRNKFLPAKVINELIDGHFYTWTLLMNNSNVLDKQDELFFSYIGSWESWVSSSKLDLKSEENIEFLSSIYIHHLQSTAKHVIKALNVNNIEATLLSADMLIYWQHKAFSMFRESNYHSWKSSLLSPSIINENFESKYIDNEALKEFIYSNKNQDIKTALVISLRNLWKETCILTAGYIFYKNKNNFSDDIKKVVFSLLNQRRIYSNDMRSLQSQNNKIEVHLILQSYLYNTYPLSGILHRGYFGYLLDLFERMDKESVIPGRVHTDRSIEFSSLTNTIKCFMIGNSTKVWSLSNNFKSFIKSVLFEYEAREDLLRNLKYFENIDESISNDVKLLFGDEELEQKLENYKKSMSDIINEIEEYQEETIRNAKIDKEKVYNFNSDCSNYTFNDLSNKVPVSLFNEIKFKKIAKQYKYSILHEFDKKYLTKDINFIDVNEYFEQEKTNLVDILNHNILGVIYDKFLKTIKKEKKFNSMEGLLNKTLEQAQSMIQSDLTPIIFICSNIIENELLYGSSKLLETLSVKQHNNDQDTYICHIDNIETYSLQCYDSDYIILTAVELFDKMICNKYEEGIYINIQIDDPSQEKLKTTINYGMKIDFKEVESFKYILKDS